MKLVGKNFYLRPFTSNDIDETYLSWLKDPEVNRFLTVRHAPPNREDAIKNLETYDGDHRFFWGIFNKDEKKIGTITLNVNKIHNTAIYGYLVGEKDYWGTGAGIQASALILDFSFLELKVRRVSGGANEKNIGSAFNFKKMGFRHEGTLRCSEIIDEVVTDALLFGILKSEWLENRKKLNY